MKKILYINFTLSKGGAETGSFEVIKSLIKKGHKITIVSLTPGTGEMRKYYEKEELKLEVLANSKLDFLLKLPFIIFKLAKVKKDIIWCSLYISTITGLIVKFFNFGKPSLFCWQHSTITKKNEWIMYKLFISKIEKIICDSEYTLNEMIKIFGKQKSYRAVDLYYAKNISKKIKKNTSDKIIIGSVGSIYDLKNYLLMVRVAKKLNEIYGEQKIEFSIAGDGNQRSEIENFIETNRMQNFYLKGFVNNIGEYYQSLDIYMQTSIIEGLCISTLEAMNHFLPSVVSDVGGMKYYIEQGQNGFKCDINDEDAFVNNISQLIDDKKLRTTIGRNANKTVIDKFSKHRFDESLNDLCS